MSRVTSDDPHCKYLSMLVKDGNHLVSGESDGVCLQVTLDTEIGVSGPVRGIRLFPRRARRRSGSATSFWDQLYLSESGVFP
jgi:hypothetical protein